MINRRLSIREAYFAGIENDQVRSRHPIDQDVFNANLKRRNPESGLSQEMLFLLATAKLNQTERFGVALGEAYGINSGAPPETPVDLALAIRFGAGRSQQCVSVQT